MAFNFDNMTPKETYDIIKGLTNHPSDPSVIFPYAKKFAIDPLVPDAMDLYEDETDETMKLIIGSYLALICIEFVSEFYDVIGIGQSNPTSDPFGNHINSNQFDV